eukprot:2626452-Alexandrium_andersonii.AAC.1
MSHVACSWALTHARTHARMRARRRHARLEHNTSIALAQFFMLAVKASGRKDGQAMLQPCS